MYRANTWLGFGLSGSTSRTLMFGADASIVWVDETDGPQAVDYYLSDYVQVSIQVFLNIFRFVIRMCVILYSVVVDGEHVQTLLTPQLDPAPMTSLS